MWQKGGLIFNVDGKSKWNTSHAQVPVVDVLTDRLRIYYATRNEQGQSNTSFIEVDSQNPSKILYIHDKPLFDLGSMGTFDDCGIMPSCIINVDDTKYLYYIGWTTRATVPYQNAVGLAISKDGGRSFEKAFEGPIITVNSVEPHFSGTSFVMKDDALFRMWYLSCIGWKTEGLRPEPLYNIKYAESENGVNWKQNGKVAIELTGDEGGIVSAAIVRNESDYRMWYGRRKQTDYRENSDNAYRIGYAESEDCVTWRRMDAMAGIDVSLEGWDSQMISYPYVVKVDGRLLMFYNGNGFGKSGFGYAEWNSK